MVNFGLSAQDFNSHAHVERDQPYKISDDFSDNFNSHAHVERDCSQVCMLDKSTISTHTLTWSVTYFQNNNIDISEISTHTLTWSVTGNSHYYISVVHNFNSHAHVERDFSLVKTEIREQAISTHTLTWSVTCLGR